MEERLKQRLVGAIVLVSLVVVFVPILLDVPEAPEEEYSPAPLPERPRDRFDSTASLDVGQPETPRLDAAVEREREREEPLSDTTAGVPREPSRPPGAPPATPAPEAVEATVTAAAPMHEAVDPPVAAVRTDPSPAHPDPSPPAPKPDDAIAKRPAARPPDDEGRQWAVQLGSFQESGNAIALRQRLRDEGYDAFVKSTSSMQGEVFRVLVGPSANLEHAKSSAVKLLLEMNIEGFVVPYPGG